MVGQRPRVDRKMTDNLGGNPPDYDLDFPLEDATGTSGLPEDDPELVGFVRPRDLRPASEPIIAAIEDAIREWPVALPLRPSEPSVLRFIRRDDARLAAWRNLPLCLRCTIPGSYESVAWDERGVLCIFCAREAERRQATELAERGGGSLIDWTISRLRWSRGGRPRDEVPSAEFIDRFEKARAILRRQHAVPSVRAFAALLEVSDSTLRDKVKRYGLQIRE